MSIRYTSAVVEENKIWLFAPDLSILCVLDKDTKKIKYVADLGDKKDNKVFLYYGIIKIGDCIYAFPCQDKADDIAIYDILQDKVKYRKIEWSREEWKRKSNKIVGAYCMNDYLYLVGQNLPIIIKINLQSFEQQIFDLGIEYTMWKNIEQIEDKLFIPSLDNKILIVFDTTNDTFELKELPIETEGIAIVRHWEGQLFVVPAGSTDIYEINLEKWIVHKKYSLGNINGLCYREYPFNNLFVKNDFLYLFPQDANIIVKINRINGATESIYTYSDEKNYRYHTCFVWNEHYIAGCYSYGEHIDLYNTETDRLEVYNSILPENIHIYWEKRLQEGDCKEISENQLGLSKFIKLVIAGRT